jgi:hypothetical protein
MLSWIILDLSVRDNTLSVVGMIQWQQMIDTAIWLQGWDFI